jgi:hypothetical protein
MRAGDIISKYIDSPRKPKAGGKNARSEPMGAPKPNMPLRDRLIAMHDAKAAAEKGRPVVPPMLRTAPPAPQPAKATAARPASSLSPKEIIIRQREPVIRRTVGLLRDGASLLHAATLVGRPRGLLRQWLAEAGYGDLLKNPRSDAMKARWEKRKSG